MFEINNFVHLHVHSEYSLLDGACRLKQLVSKAKDLGQKAVAVTDHGNMYATIDFYNECTAQGVKPIIGCEVYVAQRTRFDKVHRIDSSPYHLVLLCKDNEGYQNLIKLVSLSYTEGFYNKPRIDLDLLRKYSQGLIALSACLSGEIPRKILAQDYNGAKETALLYKSIFGKDNFYIEVQNHHLKDEMNCLPSLYKLSRETGIPLVATNDTHYLEKSDAQVQKVLVCIATNTYIDEESSMTFNNDEFYLKSSDEMSKLFSAVPQAIENSVKIAERCNVTFEYGNIKLPLVRFENVDDNIAFFKDMCIKGMYKLYGNNPSQAVKDRLKYELQIIIKMGYVDYYLIVWDFVHYAKEHKIPVGPGRGSGAGSLCAYVIGITGIDPMKYNLLFERFLNPERVSMPDFDIDFCIEGRQNVIDYVVRRYGDDHVAQIITFGTMAARGAVRDVARVMGVPYQTADTVGKLIPQELGITIEKALEKSPDFKAMYLGDAKIHELVDIARKVEGMPRHASTHAAGVVITKNPVSSYVPVQKNDESIVTQYTMTNLERLGLLKMDFLGLRNLTVIRDCANDIRKTEPAFSIESIPLDDKEVFKMLTRGDTQGVFQFESAGMRATIMKLEPVAIEDLIAVISLYRPGPMDSIPTYIQNRHNPSLVKYKHPLLKDILDVTYGCIVYQEQVMQIFRKLAGYSYGRADLVRRAMAKKKHDVMLKERQSFVYGENNQDGTVNCVGAIANGVDEKTANEIFDQMISFASYAFNKSHAAAYATVAYQTAYLKCHYYKQYMSALMTSVLDNTSKLIEYISELSDNGVKLLKPDINKSYAYFSASDDGIRFALLALKNMGRAVIDNIVSEREKNGPFVSLQNFLTRMYGKEINSRAIEALIMSGAFDSFPTNRRQMLLNYDKLMSGISENNRINLEGQIDFFGNIEETSNELQEMKIEPMDEFMEAELLEMEKSSCGIYISGHPLNELRPYADALRLPIISEIINNVKDNKEGFKDKDNVSFVCLLTSKKMFTTRSDAQMCFVDFEDTSTTIEGIIFPKIYDTFKNNLTLGNVFYINGTISLKDDEVKILVDNIVTKDLFLKQCQQKDLCVNLKSKEKAIVDSIRNVVVKYNGNNKLYFYFNDIKKLTLNKNINSVNVCSGLLKELSSITGKNNIAFIKKQD